MFRFFGLRIGGSRKLSEREIDKKVKADIKRLKKEMSLPEKRDKQISKIMDRFKKDLREKNGLDREKSFELDL